MRLVILESPFKAITTELQARNIAYLKEAIAHSLHLGESPISSVLTWATSSILDDQDPSERKLGMEAGFAWYRVAESCVVYEDLGISDGMLKGIRVAISAQIEVIHRTIHQD